MLQYAFGEAAPKSDLRAIHLRQSYGVSSEVFGNGLRVPGSEHGLGFCRAFFDNLLVDGRRVAEACGLEAALDPFFPMGEPENRIAPDCTGLHRIQPNPTKNVSRQGTEAQAGPSQGREKPRRNLDATPMV